MKKPVAKGTNPTRSTQSPEALTPKTFCEFFAGIGLVREALARSGWECVYANDIDTKKQEMYMSRFVDVEHFHLGDVHDTTEVLSRIPGRPFLATASFPCIDLSLAGHWRGFEGEHSSTFFGFADALIALGNRRPRVVLLENVIGFITSNGGKDFIAAASALAELGYWIDAFVVDARYFVPQSRPRVFVVAIQEDDLPPFVVKKSPSDWIADSWNQVMEAAPQSLRPSKLVELMRSTSLATGWAAFSLKSPVENRKPLSALIDMDDEQEWWDEAAVTKHHNMMSDIHRELVDELLKRRGTHVGTIYRRKRYGTTRAEVRFDGMAGCLRTPRGGSARQIVIILADGELKMRWMSPREYARLQGADDFPLTKNQTQNLFGFGDAVCVPAVGWVDANVLSPVYNFIASQDAVRGRQSLPRTSPKGDASGEGSRYLA